MVREAKKEVWNTPDPGKDLPAPLRRMPVEEAWGSGRSCLKTAVNVGRLEGERRGGAFSPGSNECGVFAPQILREEKMYLWQ